jgi:16S rRNA (cytosine1402-N4)-methyltransferase
MNTYHVSVLLNEITESLHIRPDGVYVDATFGAGGHSRSILKCLDAKGHVYAFDQDPDAMDNAPDDARFTLIQANFRFLKRYLRLEGVRKVDGVIADLGVSSHQLDVPERGFSYRSEAPLDMRMNPNAEINAASLLASASETELTSMLSAYGEVRNAKTLARALVAARNQAALRTTFDLNRVLEKNVIGPRMKYFSQVYQALRIAVNDELGALESLLSDALQILKPEGRLAIITFHSIEDRMVKNFFKTGNVHGHQDKDAYGNIYRPLRLVHKKAILPGDEELALNPRSRSAKLRVAEKVSADMDVLID